MKAIVKFDLVEFLITLAGTVQRKRHERLVKREANLKACIAAASEALVRTSGERIKADFLHRDIRYVQRPEVK